MGEPETGASPRAAGFLSLPSTGAGRWSGWLLVASAALILLNNLVAMPLTEPRPDLETLQRVLNVTVFASLAVAGIVGLFAIVAERERSWIAFVPVVLLALALALNLA